MSKLSLMTGMLLLSGVVAGGGLTTATAAEPTGKPSVDQPSQPIQVAQAATQPPATGRPSEKKPIPVEWMPWKDPKNPNVLVLKNEDEDSKDALVNRRDTKDDPMRSPGLVNPQRYAGGFMAFSAFPTFLGAPLAFNTGDLRAGGVEVAMVGLNLDDNPVSGARFAANKMRTLIDYAVFPGANDNYIGVEYLGDCETCITVADYGNIASYYNENQRSLEEIAKVMGEILDAGAIPMGVGGTHTQMYGTLLALAQHYGPGEFAMVHVDAHYDALSHGFGRFLHNGTMVYEAVKQGLIKGEDIIQLGLRGFKPGDEDLKWMTENKLKFHFQSEILRDGFQVVLKRILQEVKGKKLFISFDMDGIDPAYAPGVGSQEVDGLTAADALHLVRGLAIQNDIVAVEFIEWNPLTDDRHQTTGILMDRLMRSVLAGLAAKKLKPPITDPLYLAEDRFRYEPGKLTPRKLQ